MVASDGVGWLRAASRHSALALPGISGVCGPLATQDWHCQGFPAFAVSAPPRIGSARDCWLAGAFFWHCQGLLARGGFSPPGPGTARDCWPSPPPLPAGSAPPGP